MATKWPHRDVALTLATARITTHWVDEIEAINFSILGKTNANIEGKFVNLKTTAVNEFLGKPKNYLIKSITILRRGCL